MTALTFTTDMAAGARELLGELGDYPNQEENVSFQPSLLRYKAKNKINVQAKPEYQDIETSFDERRVSKIIKVTSTKTWYDDDDHSGNKKRLGESEQLESLDRKVNIQAAMIKWYKKRLIREHVDRVIHFLAPSDIWSLIRGSGYGVKFDLYTNRIVPLWHQDWDDGHALFVGLMNLTMNGAGEVPIKGAELLDFTQEARLAASDSESVLHEAYHSASSFRKELMEYNLYNRDGLSQLAEDQPFGELRWFNDAVLVHRTPPYSVNTISRSVGIDSNYRLNDVNATFFTNKSSYDMPMRKLFESMKNNDRYNFDGKAPTAQRALLRITVRQLRKHQS